MFMPKSKKIKMPEKFSDEPKGLVICYIGAGKGKTTAAMGMAIRAAGAGMDVFILQFVKAKAASDEQKKDGEWPVSCEIDFLNEVSKHLKHRRHPHPAAAGHLLPGGEGNIGFIANEQVGLGFVGILGDKKEKDIHIRQALQGLERAREIITSGEYDVVVLDEIISALEVGIIEERDILDLLKLKAPLQHIIITGHNKYPAIMKECDLITEMSMIKHPYYKGILAQRGIDY
jgi:cob(I)alamin adenosyltransferase